MVPASTCIFSPVIEVALSDIKKFIVEAIDFGSTGFFWEVLL